MSNQNGSPSPEALEQYAGQVIGYKTGELVSLMIYLGDKFNLYQALKDLGTCTAADLAAHTGLQERWLLEWLRNQTSAGLIEYKGDDKFFFPEAGHSLFLDKDHPFYLAGAFCSPTTLTELEKTAKAFRSGIGMTWDDHGPRVACMVKRMTSSTHNMLPTVIGLMNGVEEKLKAGARVLDVGCGSGVALRVLAKAYPNSTFDGFDPSQNALEIGKKDTEADGLSNITYHLAKGEDLEPRPTYDFVMTLDCMHDMTRPESVIRAIRKCLKPDGAWLIKDIRTSDDFNENLSNPMSAMFYGISVLYCMSASLSEPGGAGLGTMGFNPVLAENMLNSGGFSKFRTLDFEGDPFNSFYEVRI